MNDILVDALWDLAEREGITKQKVLAILPAESANETPRGKVTEMPKKKVRSIKNQAE
jgi:hypothetical protein